MQAGFEPHDSAAEIARLDTLFARQRAAFAEAPYPGLIARRDRLERLRYLLLRHTDEIAAAISADFGHRSPHETKALEIFPTLGGIQHAKSHLQKWMRPERRGVSIWFKPASNTVVAQPLGVVGIIVPWNYPIFLSVGPLTAALAAGNRAIIKISEYTPATGALLRRLAAQYFDEDEVCVINGGVEVAQHFATKPWDHLFFTGSTAVGRQVMRAAAENLVPVTLELGGKSPTIVGPDYPIDTAAQRILHGKCLNAGQTCVAPDYVLLPRGKVDAFIDAARAAVASWYPDLASNPDYTRVINARHFDRLEGWAKEAEAAGARLVPLAESGNGRLAPTLVLDAPATTRLMQDEIFGPLLPLVPYDTLDEAIAYVNERPRPLALYYFEHDNARIRYMLTHTISGGVGINETVVHVGQDDLPFGGVGPSGMGHYHGREGFQTFSKMKPVFVQSRLNGLPLLRPPYGKRIEQMLKLMLR